MVENQSILLIVSIFASIYLGIFIRFYLISKSQYAISKFITVKFLIRSIVFTLILTCIFFSFRKETSTNNNQTIYFSISNKDLKLQDNELKNKMEDYIFQHPELQKVGCINSNVFGTKILIPLMNKENFLQFIKRFEIAKLPKVTILNTPSNVVFLFLSAPQKTDDSFEIINFLKSFFNDYKIFELRNYLLILIMFIFSLDILFVKKSFKN